MNGESISNELAFEQLELSQSLTSFCELMRGYRIFEDAPDHIRFHGYDVKQRFCANDITGEVGIKGHLRGVGGYDSFDFEFLTCSGDVKILDYVAFLFQSSPTSSEKILFEYDEAARFWKPQSPRQMNLERYREVRHWIEEGEAAQKGECLSNAEIGYFIPPF